MKRVTASFILLLVFFCSQAQDDKLRTEINNLEQRSIQAVLQKDSATLRKLWSPTFMVNAPINKVVRGGQVEMVMGGQISYTFFKGEMEEMLVVNDDITVTMGHETVTAVIGNRNGGQTIERRYTHVWKRNKGSWLLIGRHANDICHQ